MTLLSAFDDFLTTTLAALPGVLGKLDYLAGLKQRQGGYAHWGLSRVYGEPAAQRALAEAHAILVLEILRTPLRRLIAEAELSSAAQQQRLPLYLEELRSRSLNLLPGEVSGGATRHFSSVLHALSALAQVRQRATLPAA
jgi:hypothetical protein